MCAEDIYNIHHKTLTASLIIRVISGLHILKLIIIPRKLQNVSVRFVLLRFLLGLGFKRNKILFFDRIFAKLCWRALLLYAGTGHVYCPIVCTAAAG